MAAITQQTASTRYSQMIKDHVCRIAVFGMEDMDVLNRFLQMFTTTQSRQHRKYEWRSVVEESIQFYKTIDIKTNYYLKRHGCIEYHVINAFLNEQAYEHQSVKYSKPIEPGSQMVSSDQFRRYVYYTHQSLSFAAMNTATTIATDNDVELEEKYGDEEHRVTLKEQHILQADGFILLYDIRYAHEIQKLRSYLDLIFEHKGYGKQLEQMKRDQMCFFPVSCVGIAVDPLSTEEQKHKITRSQINALCMEYCVDNARMTMYGTSWEEAYTQKRSEINGICETVANYHYYMSLSNEQCSALKSRANTTCIVL